MGILSQPSVSTDAVVLRAWPCGETSVIASLLTRELGFVRVMAKAARRQRSNLRPLVEPGRLVNVDFSLNSQRELQYLRSGSVNLDPMSCFQDLERSAFLLASLELVDRCRPPQAADGGSAPEELFAVCDAFIRMLSSQSSVGPTRLFFAFEWQLLRRHGFDPEVDCCCSCGDTATAGDHTHVMWFSASEGGLLCSTCGRHGGGRPLSVQALKEFNTYDQGIVPDRENEDMSRALRREVGAHLHRFLGFHLPGYRLPTALDLLRPVKRAEESN